MSLFSTSPAVPPWRTVACLTALALSLHAPLFAEPRFHVAEAIGHLAEHHVLGNLCHFRDDVDDVVRGHFPTA